MPTNEPTQVPTQAPTQAPTAVPAPAAADVKVIYMCGAETLKTITLTLEEGKTPVHPASALVPAGYKLLSESPVSVTVDAQGVPTPSSVVFSCEKAE